MTKKKAGRKKTANSTTRGKGVRGKGTESAPKGATVSPQPASGEVSTADHQSLPPAASSSQKTSRARGGRPRGQIRQDGHPGRGHVSNDELESRWFDLIALSVARCYSNNRIRRLIRDACERSGEIPPSNGAMDDWIRKAKIARKERFEASRMDPDEVLADALDVLRSVISSSESKPRDLIEAALATVELTGANVNNSKRDVELMPGGFEITVLPAEEFDDEDDEGAQEEVA